MKDRKIFIIDTSVLLYDCNSIHSFPEIFGISFDLNRIVLQGLFFCKNP